MAEVGLQRPGVMAVIREFVAIRLLSVPQYQLVAYRIRLIRVDFRATAPAASPRSPRSAPPHRAAWRLLAVRAPCSAMIYSITSSAVASSVGGTWRPIALAVLRLIIRSILVGCSTGWSAGLAPLSILST